jgi:hypothetical protein
MQQKMQEYIENGAWLGWLLNPVQQKVHVYRPAAVVEILNRPVEIPGAPPLNGFTFLFADLLD